MRNKVLVQGRLSEVELQKLMQRQLEFKRVVESTSVFFDKVSSQRQLIANKTSKSLTKQQQLIEYMMYHANVKSYLLKKVVPKWDGNFVIQLQNWLNLQRAADEERHQKEREQFLFEVRNMYQREKIEAEERNRKERAEIEENNRRERAELLNQIAELIQKMEDGKFETTRKSGAAAPSYSSFFSRLKDKIQYDFQLKDDKKTIQTNSTIKPPGAAEENVQAFFNQVFEAADLPLVYADTHKLAYINEFKPDVTFFSSSSNVYQRSVMSYFAIVVGELKSQSENIDTPTPLGQILFYMGELVAKHRTHIYGFISNYKDTIFIRMDSDQVAHMSPKFSNVFEVVGPNTVTAKCFYQFLAKAREEAHFLLPSSLENYKITFHIGSGRTSNVFQVTNNFGVSTMKVKKQVETSVDTLSNEASLLITLRNLIGLKYCDHLPRIVAHNDNYILFEKVYIALAPHHLKVDTVTRFLDFLSALHNCGVCHRDIRPENLMYDSREKCIVLVDFGFAISSTSNAPLAGTITFAAQELLKAIKFHFFQFESKYHPKYDMESFVKSAFYLIHQFSSVHELDMNVPNDTQSFFNKLIQINRVWEDIERDNSKFKSILTKIRKQEELTQEDIQILST